MIDKQDFFLLIASNQLDEIQKTNIEKYVDYFIRYGFLLDLECHNCKSKSLFLNLDKLKEELETDPRMMWRYELDAHCVLCSCHWVFLDSFEVFKWNSELRKLGFNKLQIDYIREKYKYVN